MSFSCSRKHFAALFFVLILVSGLTVSAWAEVATESEARLVAQNWMNLLTAKEGAWDKAMQPTLGETGYLRQDGTVLAYCIPVLPRGYIVVPVLKEMAPVKASSETSNLDPEATVGMTALLREVLAHRTSQYVARYGSLDAPQPTQGDVMYDRSQRAEWDRYLQDPVDFAREVTLEKSAAIAEVGPLLTSSWHQGAPFNDVCPVGYGGSNTLVGCVATAAAQLMQYHQWPPAGTGSRAYYWGGDDSCTGSTSGSTISADFSDPYDWDNILDDGNDISTQAEIDAVAELCYEVGIAYSMDYGVCASGAITARSTTVFSNYFGYASGVDGEDRHAHSAASWFSTIQDEINQGRPMMYRIVGHAIVCDGWRDVTGSNQYHMNYGWDDNHTGWYTIDNLYMTEDIMAEDLYRYIIPLRSSWGDVTTGALADAGQTEGMSWFDKDDDGDLDVALANQEGLVLLQNDGAGSYSDVTTDVPAGLGAGRAVASADFDSDGDLDLYLVRDALPNVLLRNDGGIFTDVTTAPLDDLGRGTSAAWIDFDLDGDLDLSLTNNDSPLNSNKLWRHDGSGGFVDATPSAMSSQGGTAALSWGDYDGDDDLDLYLTSASESNRLLRNDLAGGFVDVTDAVLGDTGTGVGAAWGDYDGDGDPDLYLVNDGANKMLRNDGGTFINVTAGVLADAGEGANATWFDQDRDGDLDLYVSNVDTDNELLINDGTGVFSAATEGLLAGSGVTLNSTIADFDGDGDQDVYLANSGANELLLNEMRSHNWVKLDFVGQISNARGVGTRVRVANDDFSLTRWVGIDGDGRSQTTAGLEFGLGWYNQVDILEVTWPTGETVVLTDLPVNQVLEIIESPFAVVSSGPIADAGAARGISWVDYDSDGDQDAYVVNYNAANCMLRNDGSGTFTDAGILADSGPGNAATWADFDGDGDQDVYLTNEGTDNVLYRNDGAGVFNVQTVMGLDNTGDSFGSTWIDYDRDGYLDLYIVNNNSANRLFRGYGDIGGGTWMWWETASPISDTGPGIMGSWGDYDSDGLPDMYLVGNAQPDKLFQNAGALGFQDNTGVYIDENSGTSYGAAWGDYDNDGDLDLYVVNDGPMDHLHQNNNGTFTEVTGGPLADRGAGRGASWGDYDNDGDLDLYVSRKGQPDLLLCNEGGNVFSHGMSALSATGPDCTGIAWADYDGDGDLDVYLGAEGANQLLENKLNNGNHWLHLDLVATAGYPDALGTTVRLVTAAGTQWRTINAGSGYMSQDSRVVEFGLGAEASIDTLEISWPDGTVDVRLSNSIQVDRKITLTQGVGPSPVAENNGLPRNFGMHRASPNPFNPVTRISFDLPVDQHVKLSVYSVAGALVATLVDEQMVAGTHQAVWNGQSSRGRSAASGVYFFRMTAGDFTSTRRAVLLK
jgi:Peptidase C10 family/ASPIC and UnbV/FG-GAP-like repeat/FlgD Ig-like domain